MVVTVLVMEEGSDATTWKRCSFALTRGHLKFTDEAMSVRGPCAWKGNTDELSPSIAFTEAADMKRDEMVRTATSVLEKLPTGRKVKV